VRISAGEDPDDAQLVELSLRSEAFRRMWARHDVKAKSFGRKRFEHPQVRPLELDYECLRLADPDQVLVTYTATPGSASETGLNLLAALCREQDRGAVGDDDRVLEVRRR
jgi:MmyB-like transcription regulator ligand binding domain